MGKPSATSRDHPDPFFRTRVYKRNFDVVYQQFFNMARRPIKGWSLEEREMAQGILRAGHSRSFPLPFKAIVTARVRKLEDGSCEVDVESADAPNRRGGNHKRRVKKWLKELDDALSGGNPYKPRYQ